MRPRHRAGTCRHEWDSGLGWALWAGVRCVCGTGQGFDLQAGWGPMGKTGLGGTCRCCKDP